MARIQNRADPWILKIRRIEVPDLRLRRVQSELKHVAVLVRVIAPCTMPDTGIPYVNRAGRTARPDLSDHMLIPTYLTCAHVPKVRTRDQECPSHLIRCIHRKEGELDVKVVLPEIDYRILVHVRTLELTGFD